MITTLSQLIAQVESNSRLDAVRFEPAYHPDKRAFALAQKAWPGLSYNTYEVMLACSWGEFQIMGDNLYLLGLDCSLPKFCADADMQCLYFKRFCASRNIDYTLAEIFGDRTKLQNFAHRYNGDPIAYSTRMLNVYGQMNGSKNV